MEKDDLLKKQIISTLNEKVAQQHASQLIIRSVFASIEQRRHQKYNRWGIGLAFAAAITGISIIPSGIDQKQTEIMVNTPKLTPQLADDLEMLLVLGEDIKHGS